MFWHYNKHNPLTNSPIDAGDYDHDKAAFLFTQGVSPPDADYEDYTTIANLSRWGVMAKEADYLFVWNEMEALVRSLTNDYADWGDLTLADKQYAARWIAMPESEYPNLPAYLGAEWEWKVKQLRDNLLKALNDRADKLFSFLLTTIDTYAFDRVFGFDWYGREILDMRAGAPFHLSASYPTEPDYKAFWFFAETNNYAPAPGNTYGGFRYMMFNDTDTPTQEHVLDTDIWSADTIRDEALKILGGQYAFYDI